LRKGVVVHPLQHILLLLRLLLLLLLFLLLLLLPLLLPFDLTLRSEADQVGGENGISVAIPSNSVRSPLQRPSRCIFIRIDTARVKIEMVRVSLKEEGKEENEDGGGSEGIGGGSKRGEGGRGEEGKEKCTREGSKSGSKLPLRSKPLDIRMRSTIRIA